MLIECAIKTSSRIADVVTEMYESLEVLAKTVTGRGDKDLSGNSELFIKAIQVSDIYKPILKECVVYGNKIRHAEKMDNPNRTSRVRKLNRLCTWPGFYSSCCNQRSPGLNGYINGHINAVNPSQSKRLKWRSVTCD